MFLPQMFLPHRVLPLHIALWLDEYSCPEDISRKTYFSCADFMCRGLRLVVTRTVLVQLLAVLQFNVLSVMWPTLVSHKPNSPLPSDYHLTFLFLERTMIAKVRDISIATKATNVPYIYDHTNTYTCMQ